ncbi:DUF3667 domain-containing protein [Psychroserpens sp. SPM9]|uniref:DUF3667 domain-containing protein n=1 Tax=Psychroserpens sp. SPM9 TaxID=2975598 RepID=UPI0021A92170|nr:DUF3667 domain-containing protein [Psychroserpens sp. SPM9]MDG5492608.1 DUF3667 domain-containing protein [Psychroserpens sp. SPM9]
MTCKNCDTLLNSEQHYCYECGAKVIKNRLTTKNLFSEFSEQFLSYDNKFLITFFDLFRKPESVIHGYITGTRKKYINVIQYLAISLTLLGLQLFILNKFYPDFFAAAYTDFGNYFAMYPENTRVEAKKFMSNYLAFINEYQSLVYIIGIPFTAIVTYFAFRKEKLLNYIEHVVVNTYLTAQYVVFTFFLYLIFAVLNLNVNVLINISLVLYLFYYGFVFYRIYKLRVTTIFLRFLLSLAILGVMFLIVLTLGIIIGIVYLKFLK